jgi:hypothetical protein
MLANADAYVSDTLDGSGHLRVTVEPNCVTVDFVRAYLPADTVSGLHHNGEVAFSYTVGSCLISSVQERESAMLSVFPNPADESVLLRIPDGMQASRFTLSDLLGKTVLESDYPQLQLSALPAGIYLIRAYTTDSVLQTKLIVRH